MSTATAPAASRVKPPKVKTQQPMFIGGKWVDSVSGKTFADPQPRHRRNHLPGRRGRQGRHRPGRQGRPQGVRGRPVAEDERRRARPAAQQAGRPHREQQGRTGRPRIARQRQAATRFARRRPAADHQVLPLLRRLGRQDPRQDHPRRGHRTSATRGTSRSAWSARSSRGTSRC